MAKNKAKKDAPAPAKKAAPAPAKLSACECSAFRVLIGLRTAEDGDLTWDSEETTDCAGGKTKSTFLPGHDAKLKSFLIKAGVNEWEVRRGTGGVDTIGDAMSFARGYGFQGMVEAGIKRGLGRQAEKSKPRQAAKKTAEPTKKPLAKVVADEQAKHEAEAAEQVRQREKSADWSDADKAAEQHCELTDKPEVKAKVGRWEYRGVVCEAKHLHYLAKDGHTRKQAEKGKFEILEELEPAEPTTDLV